MPEFIPIMLDPQLLLLTDRRLSRWPRKHAGFSPSGPRGSRHEYIMAETQQFRWALQVRASHIDMEDAIARYGANTDPTIRSVGSDSQPLFLLTSPQLDRLDTPREVEKLATKLLAIVNGTLFVLVPDRIPLTSGGVQEQTADGKGIHHLIAADSLSRVGASVQMEPSWLEGSPRRNTLAQRPQCAGRLQHKQMKLFCMCLSVCDRTVQPLPPTCTASAAQ